MLAGVLVALVILTTVALSLVGLVSTTQKLDQGTAASNKRIRDIDGALETALNQLRNATELAGVTGIPCSSGTITIPAYLGINVVCSNPTLSGVTNPNAAYRVLQLTASSAGTAVGRATVRIDDQVGGGVKVVGASVTVCEWQIGGQLATPAGTCPT